MNVETVYGKAIALPGVGPMFDRSAQMAATRLKDIPGAAVAHYQFHCPAELIVRYDFWKGAETYPGAPYFPSRPQIDKAIAWDMAKEGCNQ